MVPQHDDVPAGSQGPGGAGQGCGPAAERPAGSGVAAEYHDADFDWSEAAAEAAALVASGGGVCAAGCAPGAQGGACHASDAGEEGAATATGQQPGSEPWERFHAQHASARFFKPRRYLLHTFPALRAEGLRLLELGCGAGASLIPILLANPSARVLGCDISASALALARSGAQAAGVDASRLATLAVDLEGAGPLAGVPPRHDTVLLVFTLSALTQRGEANALRAARAALAPGGRCLVRDYGLYDMVHLRFLAGGAARGPPMPVAGTTHGSPPPDPPPTRAFRRGDGTLARFLALQELVAAAAAAGLECEEAKYACVAVRRRGAPDLRRVFLHAVLRRAGEG
ncbi:hypothetical protein ACKKBF_B09610 [Auxenochlorella protothecoides x Auxenochlorella symbiontica]